MKKIDEQRTMILALFQLFLFSLTNADPLSQTCISVMGDLLNISSFPGSVAHGIHSLTVEDAKFYFDPNIGDKIKIPTINQNVSGDVLLEYLPFANYDHAFTTMALKNLDVVMRNIGEEDWSIRGLNTLEKISHVLHMQALWKKAGEVYKQFIKNPPKNEKFCSCITDIGQNEIVEALIQMAERIRGEELDMDTVRKGLRIKRSPDAKRMYNTFSGGPNYRTFYSDFSAKEFQRNKRSPHPKKMYNTFNGGPNYRTFYSDFDGKEFLSKIQKRSPEAKRMYNTFNGGPNYRTFYSDFSAMEAFKRQKRSPEPKKMYNSFNGGPNYREFYSDFSGSKSLPNIQKRSPEAERMYNTFEGGPNYREFYSDFSAKESQRQKRSPEPRKMYNTFDGGPKYEYFYSDYKGKSLSNMQKRSPEPRKMYNTFDGGPKYEYFYSDYKGKSLSSIQKRSPEPRKMYNNFDDGPNYTYFYSGYKPKALSAWWQKRSSDDDINQRRNEVSKDPEMPQLTDSESWKKWKAMLQRSMMKEDEYTNLAAFMYCSLKNNAMV